jgi:hypothetical protein
MRGNIRKAFAVMARGRARGIAGAVRFSPGVPGSQGFVDNPLIDRSENCRFSSPFQ